MTTITLNNDNKTQIEFTYNNGLPYKKSITPKYEYGTWKENNQIALIKIKLSENDLSLIKNKNHITCKGIYGQKDKIWFDLEDVYLILESNKYLSEKVQNEFFILIFYQNETPICSWGFDE